MKSLVYVFLSVNRHLGYLVVLIDDGLAPYKTGMTVPVDDNHIHLDDGSSTFMLSLPKG